MAHFEVVDHRLQQARFQPSPNHGERPAGTAIDLLVIHNISLPPGQFGGDCIERFFLNQLDAHEHPFFAEISDLQVSAHLLVDRCGQVVQFVPFDRRAWHAGRSCFQGRDECNDFSIGIELEGTDETPYTDAQYEALAGISRALMRAYPALSPEGIVGHCDIAPGRKSDPGPAFDWARFSALLAQA
ncbi:1,6-anhydro-N-acetylmuramyl-L-alanine amidase AmpD [Motiliproteus sp. SC1-56]|uniref:1,6-anhydro-N-acetylmuramyl-L-alanine amidase AmpD n=1 Tax=Motiliproteus sp. SC1-56 TaxID=2799565 RepID=UPI001A8CB728|nr:1,6-anhydro-N-acetylmuramyl-L-alanine amidase AmpD [Motiliproteus sp. SC1-56]